MGSSTVLQQHEGQSCHVCNRDAAAKLDTGRLNLPGVIAHSDETLPLGALLYMLQQLCLVADLSSVPDIEYKLADKGHQP